jgi:hypothetical protein
MSRWRALQFTGFAVAQPAKRSKPVCSKLLHADVIAYYAPVCYATQVGVDRPAARSPMARANRPLGTPLHPADHQSHPPTRAACGSGTERGVQSIDYEAQAQRTLPAGTLKPNAARESALALVHWPLGREAYGCQWQEKGKERK